MANLESFLPFTSTLYTLAIIIAILNFVYKIVVIFQSPSKIKALAEFEKNRRNDWQWLTRLKK